MSISSILFAIYFQINHYQPDRSADSKMSSHDSFQTYIQKCIEVYTEDISSGTFLIMIMLVPYSALLDEMQRSLLIPANPSFIKLIDEFTDKDNDLMKYRLHACVLTFSYCRNENLCLKSLKETKLLLLLQ